MSGGKHRVAGPTYLSQGSFLQLEKRGQQVQQSHRGRKDSKGLGGREHVVWLRPRTCGKKSQQGTGGHGAAASSCGPPLPCSDSVDRPAEEVSKSSWQSLPRVKLDSAYREVCREATEDGVF